ncbi:polyketide synthase [Penicillium angulare]|uniref:polyketide synthase n=1 Tax=Penicillium angulare TaxID=116970 RepID=UPI00254090A5|nr:polyketide synthase [Penicillium angulare]KAJ5266789.1 polyketide synthase [Penicillium angulare]
MKLDPVTQMLEARSDADPELKALMTAVSSSQASQEQLLAFQENIDELTAAASSTQQTQPLQQPHSQQQYTLNPAAIPSQNEASFLGNTSAPEPIAIVGMGCRFPGGNTSTSKLWDFLAEGKSGFSEFPPDRFSPDAFRHPNRERPGSMVSRGGFILNENAKDFDHSLFGLSPTETLTLDPAQRKLLEVTYEAFESAGEPLDRVRGSRTGVFVGNMNNDHETMQHRDVDHILPYTVTGSGTTILSNRLSYIFDLQGPSMVVDTACSASLYAMHLAVNAIRNNDCDAAVVAASNLILSPDAQLMTTKLGAISPTSICHSFDIAADGYARAEGIGALYLKPLSKAISDGDPIRACIRGTSFNANGKTGGISRPSADGQEAVIRRAYEAAGNLNPDDTGYLECHGTGTPVGDPIEVSAVGRVFSTGRFEDPLLIGSVKTNLGHSEAASGMSQVMKAIMSMENDLIPATIGIKQFNPAIDFDGSRTKVVTKLTPWPKDRLKRTSINSFGYGGANAHCILDHPSILLPGYIQRGLRICRSLLPYPSHNEPLNEFPNGWANGANFVNKERSRKDLQLVPSREAAVRRLVLYPFSAHTESSLKAQIASFGPTLDAFNLEDILYTLGARRSRFDHRGFLVKSSSATEESKPPIPVDSITFGKLPDTPVTKLGFVFTGQGAQWPGMGSKLLEEYAVFRSTITYLDSVLDALSTRPPWSIEQVLSETNNTEMVHLAEVSQTVCTALQIAMVDLLRTWNVEPVVTVGHSSGEIAAAYAAGRVLASEAIVLAYSRGQAVSRNQQKGAMLAVGLKAEDAAIYMKGFEHDVKVAAVNSPSGLTLSGEIEAVTRLAQVLDGDGVFNRMLKTGGNAYHSHHMIPVGEVYASLVNQGMCEIKKAGFSDAPSRDYDSVHWISSVTPQKAPPTMAAIDPAYWRENLESPVQFSSAIETLAQEFPVNLLIEIGPHAALGGPIKQIGLALKENNVNLPPYLGSLKRGENDCLSILTLAGQLFLKGAPVNLAAVNATDSNGHLTHGYPCIDLPGYQYDYGKTPIYYENRVSREFRLRKFPRHDLLGSRQPGGSPTHPSWKNVIRSKDLPWLEDHKLQSHAVLPGTAYLTMAVEAARQIGLEEGGDEHVQIRAFKLRNVAIRSTLSVPDTDTGIETVLNMERLKCVGSRSSIELQFSISSFQADVDTFTEHCSGLISIDMTDPILWDRLKADKRSRKLDITRWYDRFADAGLVYGPAFQGLSNLEAFWGSNISQAHVSLCPTAEMVNGGESKYFLHPATLDACLQLILISCNAGQVENMKSAFVPIHVGEATIWTNDESGTDDSQVGQAIATGYAKGLRAVYGRVQLHSSSGKPLLDIGQIRCISYEGGSMESDSKGSNSAREPFCRTIWRPDIDFLSRSQASKLFPEEQISRDTLRDLDTLAEVFITKAQDLSFNGTGGHSEFVRWVSNAQGTGNRGMMDTTIVDQIHARLGGVMEAQALQKLSVHLPNILRGESNSIQVLMEADLLRELEVSGLATRAATSQLSKVVDLLAHKYPNLSILEVCGRSGGVTSAVLDTLDAEDTFKRFQSYTFTDPQGWCVKDAQGRFADIPDMLYQTLDLDKDLEMQNFETQKYDLVIAPPSLTWSDNLPTALENIHLLLKPGGKLILLQTVNGDLALEMMTRTLAARWDRDFTPFRSHAQWNKVLSTAQFSNVEHVLNDYSETEISTVMVTGKLPPPLPVALQLEESSDVPAVYLIYRDHPPPLIQALEQRLAEKGLKPITTELLFATTVLPSNPTLISLIDIESPTILGTAEQFEALRDLILKSANLTWVSLGSLVHQTNPESACMEGLLRSVRNEEPLLNISFIGLDHGFDADLDRAAELLVSVVTGIQTVGASEFGKDHEYSLDDGSLYIPRHVFDKTANNFFSLLHGFDDAVRPQVVDKEYPFRASYKQPGVLSSLQFEIENDFFQPLPDGWVEIETKAIGLIMKDLSVALGKFDWPYLSNEVAGIVTKVGPNTTKLQAGDRVFGAMPGNMGNYTRQHETLVQKIPTNASFAEATSMPISHLAAVYALKHLGRLQPDESVLIQSALGGLGIAAMQVARSVGAKIYATVGTEEKKKLLMSDYGIPAERIFNSRSLEFTAEIMRATQGLGIDVILNSTSGNAMHESWRCIASFGRFIDVGRMNVLADDHLSLDVFKRNASFSSFDMGVVLTENPRLFARLMQEVREMWEMKTIHPITPIKTFDISELEAAMKEFAKGTHVGKFVITFDKPKSELMLSQKPRRVTFDPNSTYLLVGCLGGLGRSLATWMVDHGARHLAFLSRSGAERPEAASLIEDLAARGAKPEIIQGSVTDRDMVMAAVHQISRERPLKGVIHAAMSEGDAVFRNAQHSQIQSVLAPKVTGTLNLHDATLGHDLDFFLMTSSTVAAMGTLAQGAYCGANAFQDAFARHRKAQGLPATTFAVGLIKEIGFIREATPFQQMLERVGSFGISETEFLQLLETVLHPDAQFGFHSADPLSSAQISIGFEPARLHSKFAQHGRMSDLVWHSNPHFQSIIQAVCDQSSSSSSQSKSTSSIRANIETASTETEARNIALDGVVEHLARLLGLEKQDVNSQAPITRYGIDSLIAAEMRTWLMKTFGVEMTLLQLLSTSVKSDDIVESIIMQTWKSN